MTTTRSTAKNENQAKDRDRELERIIRDALVLAAGKRAANQALRRARSRTDRAARRRLGYIAGHMAGYGTLLAYIWHRRRTPNHPAA
jgi:hypothetical protein